MEFTNLLWLVVGLLGLFGFVAVWALVAVYAERKISAFIQDRLGPMEAGPYGTLQTLADVLKLLQKELIVPAAADKPLFWLAPLLIFASVFAGFAVVPFLAEGGAPYLNIGLLFLLAVISVEVVGMLMAGWGSNNKYALLGAVRAVSQIVSYEVPAGLALLAVVLMLGTMNLHELVAAQGVQEATVTLWGLWEVSQIGGILTWSVVRYPHLLVAFVIFYISALAESNRAPFDIPEAESELIAGFHTEYSGMAFALIMLAEYGNLMLLSMLGVILFLGGWHSPLPNLGDALPLFHWTTGLLWAPFWLLFKSLLVVSLTMWIRWTYPRMRADQLMLLCWKWLTPIGLGLLFVSALWRLAELGALHF